MTRNLKGLGLRNRVSLHGKNSIPFNGDGIVLSVSNRLLQELKNTLNAIKDSFCLLALYFIAIRGSRSGLH